MKIVQLQLSKQATATYPSVTSDLHVNTAPCHHENVIFRVLTHMLLLRTLSRSRSLHPNHSRDHCRLHVHIPKHSLSLRVRRLNPIRQPNTEQFQGDPVPSVNPARSERNRTEENRNDAGAPSVLHRACEQFMALVDACRTRSADTRSVLRVRLRQPLSGTAQVLLQQLWMLLQEL